MPFLADLNLVLGTLTGYTLTNGSHMHSECDWSVTEQSEDACNLLILGSISDSDPYHVKVVL